MSQDSICMFSDLEDIIEHLVKMIRKQQDHQKTIANWSFMFKFIKLLMVTHLDHFLIIMCT